MSPRAAEVVIIGAGVLGALQAYRLTRRGHRVMVIEKWEPCRGTTGRTFAWTSFRKKRPLFYNRFSQEAVTRYKPLAEEMDADFWWRPCHSIYPVLDESEYEDKYAETEALRKEGFRIRWVDREDALRIEPHMSPATLGAALCENEGFLDPFRLVYFALNAARAAGAELRFGEEVTGFEKSGNRITAVRTNKETLPCAFAVNAAGIRSPEIGRLAGAPIPLDRIKGEVLLTEKLPPIIRGVVGPMVRQTITGNVLIGFTEEPERQDLLNTTGNLTRLARGACRTLPVLRRARIIRCYAGVRPYPIDRVSVIGPTERCGGLLWSTTHSGITLGALIAEVIADFVEGKRHPAWDERFSPDRFAKAELRPA